MCMLCTIIDTLDTARCCAVEVSFANGNAAGVLDVSISSDYLAGRDPSAVFNACVQNRSGQFPRRALIDMPGWRV